MGFGIESKNRKDFGDEWIFRIRERKDCEDQIERERERESTL